MSRLLCKRFVVIVKSFPVLPSYVVMALHLAIIYCINFPKGVIHIPYYLLRDASATRHIGTLFYGDLVYKFKIIVAKPNFSDLF